jgi:hypothetical protein
LTWSKDRKHLDQARNQLAWEQVEPTASRSQSPGRPCAAVCTRRITCVDALATLAREGGGRRSLLHGCYTSTCDTG